MQSFEPLSARRLSNLQAPNTSSHNQVSSHKMDILFFNSVVKLRRRKLAALLYFIFKLLVLTIFLPIDINMLKTDQAQLLTIIWVGMAVSVIHLLTHGSNYQHSYRDCQQNNLETIRLAADTNHSIAAEPLSANQLAINKLRNCVSATVYNAETDTLNTDARVSNKLKRHYERVYAGLIEYSIMQKHYGGLCMLKVGRALSAAMIVAVVVGLLVEQPSIPEIVVLSVYAGLEAWNVRLAVLAVLVLVLSPIICLIACCLFCCKRGAQGARKPDARLKIPESQAATFSVIKETDGICSICFQDFVPKQKVILLPCSSKHVFHEGCLRTWLHAAQTCPLCRFRLDQEQYPNYRQQQNNGNQVALQQPRV